MSDRVYWAMLYAVLSIGLLVSVVASGEWTDSGYPHPMLIGTVLSGGTAVGLWLRKRWGQWCGILFSVASIALVTNHLSLQGVTVTSVGTLRFSCYAIWLLWHVPVTPFEELLVECSTPECHQLIDQKVAKFEEQIANWNDGIVILRYDPPRRISLDAIADAADRAFGKTFERRRESMDDPSDAGIMAVFEKQPIVAGDGDVFVCFDPPCLISIHIEVSQESTLTDASVLVDSIMLGLQLASTKQECWENPYIWTAMLAAELVGDVTGTSVLPYDDVEYDSATCDIASELRAFANSWSPENGQTDF
ncbi:MAG: hypothetical protein KDA93_06185 [Planctomycetaceae bacterium]|nr:hypothetical protein [Planctomycetaceae bacterium]